MKLSHDLVEISVLESQIPKLTKDQEGKLLGGFASLHPASQLMSTIKGQCKCKGLFSCKEQCACQEECTIINNNQCPCTGTPVPDPDTTTTVATGFGFGITMLF